MARNPLKDQLAVVGVGSTAYGRDLQRSELSLGLEAAIRAIEDAGLDKQEIDGICGTGMDPLAVGGAGFLTLQGALGIEKTTWQKNGWLGSCFVYAAEAVFSGLCDAALVVQAYTRGLGMSRSAARDPFRLRAAELDHSDLKVSGRGDFARRWIHSGEPYAAWMARYLHDYGADKDVFGRIAVNNRTHATRNPRATMRTPITLEDYHASRIIWEPMQLLDMDVPVDCGEALVITTAERARDLRHDPVYIHAMSLGGSRCGEYYDNSLPWTENALWVAAAGLWKAERAGPRRPRPLLPLRRLHHRHGGLHRGGGLLRARRGRRSAGLRLGRGAADPATRWPYPGHHQRRRPLPGPRRRLQLLYRGGAAAARWGRGAPGTGSQDGPALRRQQLLPRSGVGAAPGGLTPTPERPSSRSG